MRTPWTRRSFIAATGSMMLAPGLRARGANDRVRLAVLGVRGKGRQHMNMFQQLPGVQVVALCDPDRDVLAERAKEMTERHGQKVDTHLDLRQVYDRRDIDAVVIATPNHWHALATIWALQAGKDVYVEKPISHDIREGRRMVEAVEKHSDRIVVAGIQRRSDEHLPAAFEQLRAGKLGRILRARLLHYRVRKGIGNVKHPQPVPESVDYNLWAGPAPMSPIWRQRFHYDWHWFWETGNGDLGNNGPHGIDLCRWCLGYDHPAPRVVSLGGRYAWEDHGQTPNMQITWYDYDPAPILVEVRNLAVTPDTRTPWLYRNMRGGVIIECEHGYFAGMEGGALYDYDGRRIEKVDGDSGRHHQRNFIRAVRSRDRSDITCSIKDGHVTTTLCHQGNISYRLGQKTAPAALRETIANHPQFAETFDSLAAHLDAYQVDLAQSPLTLGPPLAMNVDTEMFTGAHADAANAMHRRVDRAPFVLPEP
jgi:predicted dehydrogenase